MRTHIIFGESAGLTLKQALKRQQINEQVVIMVDDLMWGPLGNVLLEHVQAERLNWWEQVLNDEDKPDFIAHLRASYKNFSEWANAFTDNESLLFWVGDSPTEYTGLMSLLAYLPKSIPVSVVMVSSAYYKRYGKFKPHYAGEITSEKMLPLLEDAKSLSPRGREGYVTNWTQLLKDNGSLRLHKNRQIETVSEDYFDEEILTCAKRISQQMMFRKSDGFLPAVRLVGEVMGHQKQKIMDILIDWRIRCLIQRNELNYQGSLSKMRLYTIKPVVD